MPYTVRIEENAHYADESERYTLGEFETAEAALSAARRVVDEDLDALYRGGEVTVQIAAKRHKKRKITEPIPCQPPGLGMPAWVPRSTPVPLGMGRRSGRSKVAPAASPFVPFALFCGYLTSHSR